MSEKTKTFVTNEGVKIRIAGYNLPINPKTGEIETGEGGTPEAITASYARISRSPKSIEDLRIEAIEDVEKARRSNERIVYEYGHGSIAEHAVFNIDIEGISRIALEVIESHRLASYTERSQRYVSFDFNKNKTIEDYFIIPEKETEFIQEQGKLLGVYSAGVEVYKTLINHGIPKEDARYFLPLGTRGQVGITVNARELEYMIRSFLGSPLQEVRNIGKGIYSIVHNLAPSLIKYIAPSDYDALNATDKAIGMKFHNLNIVLDQYDKINVKHENIETGNIWLLNVNFPYFMHNGELLGIIDLWQHEKHGNSTHGEIMFDSMISHDSLPRIFEFIDFTFVMEMSASAFAQLKRHRTSVYIPGIYTTLMTIPPSVQKLMNEDNFIKSLVKNIVQHAGTEYELLRTKDPEFAPYVVLQGFRRKVLWKVNARSLANFLRLRLDLHAQWDIRSFANAIYKVIARYLDDDFSFLFLGKDVVKSYLNG